MPVPRPRQPPEFYVRREDEHSFVYGPTARNSVIIFQRMGLGRKAIARLTGISIRTVGRWCPTEPPDAAVTGTRRRPERGRRGRPVTCIDRDVRLIEAELASYAYLLGLYLGDGHIAAHRRGVYQLRISLDSRYPALIGEAVRSMRAALPRNRVYVTKHRVHNAVVVGCSSKALPTLFPQHGPGRKHDRRIRLASWQRSITFVHAEELIRGLIHSDG